MKNNIKFNFSNIGFGVENLLDKIIESHEVPSFFKEYPDILKDFTFDDLCGVANARIIVSLIENKYLREQIKTPEDFLRLCFFYNTNLAVPLLEDKRIKKMMLPLLKHSESLYLELNFYDPAKQKKLPPLSPELYALTSIQRCSETKPTKFYQDDKSEMELLKNFSSIRSFTNHMLYGKTGFYFGTVDFQKHFTTYASDEKLGPSLAAAFALQIYHARLKLIKLEKIKPKDKFRVLECGAGTGNLCKNILTTIEKMSVLNETWADLYETLQYNILEKSPALIKIQTQTNKKFGDKVQIFEGDATSLHTIFSENSFAMIITNELVDAIMPDVIVKHPQRDFVITQVVPLMEISDFKCLKMDESWKSSVIKRSNKLVGLLNNYGYSKPSKIVFSEEDYLIFHEARRSQLIGEVNISYLPINIVSVKHDERINNYIAKNYDFCNAISLNGDHHLQIGAKEYILQAQKILIPKGEIITVDYCFYANSDRVSSPYQFKVINYQNEKVIHENIFESPGLQDISISVNMTNLADTEGYQKLFYGKQEQLSLDTYPEEILSAESKLFFEKTSSTSNYVVLVQEKSDPGAQAVPLEPDAKRFKGGPLPITRSEIIQQQEKLFSTLAEYPHLELCREAAFLCRNQYGSCLTEIKQKNYGAALRKACAVGSAPLVNLLLTYKNQLPQDFNINEKSTNGNTAYDWVEKANVKNIIKDKIREMLRQAGAKTEPALTTPVLISKR